jgi:tetratricopeptide (TPR) repeat protein
MPRPQAAEAAVESLSNQGSNATGGRPVPQTSVSIDWILAQVGQLADGSVATLRFRENIESAAVTLVDLEAWALQSLQPPRDTLHRCALQDLVHTVAKRTGMQVQYGNYDRQGRGWLPFDGLWWLDSRNFVCVNVYADRLTKLDLEQLLNQLNGVHALGGIFAESMGTVVLVLAAGYSAELEPVLRSHAATESVRLLGIDTLFDIARMRAEGALSMAQLPVLFSPFDSTRLGQVVDFLERFVSRCEDSGYTPAELPAEASPACEPRKAAEGARTLQAAVAQAERSIRTEPAVARAEPACEPPAAGPGPERAARLEMLREVLGLFKAGKHSECLPLLEKFLSIDESNPRAWEIFGDLSLKTGRHGEAIRAYGRVVALAPPSRAISLRLANLYENQGDLREAVRVLEAYSRAMPAEAREVRWLIAQLLARAKDYRSSLRLCEQLLNEGPWDRAVVELRDQCRRTIHPVVKEPPARRATAGLRHWFGSLLGQRA